MEHHLLMFNLAEVILSNDEEREALQVNKLMWPSAGSFGSLVKIGSAHAFNHVTIPMAVCSFYGAFVLYDSLRGISVSGE